jgi:H+-translocating NAD(P) transhydrogenase subunit alpha
MTPRHTGSEQATCRMVVAGVLRERSTGERRVAIVPETTARLRAAGVDVVVESGAGAAASFPDRAYRQAGATVATLEQLIETADVVACVAPPDHPLRPGQALVGLLDPLRRPDLVRHWMERGVTAVSLDLLPRTLSRAQSMDALTSQAAIAGYKAVLLAASTFERYFPMLTTAVGTTPPARVLVLGAGVSGLAAIGAARRLGAVVTAYDVRPQARSEVASLGAKFLELSTVPDGAGTGGYARTLTQEEQRSLQRELADHIARADVVITTAQVPGRRPPLLVTGAAVAGMAAGSVVVDLAASDLGGNVEGSEPGRVHATAGGVTLIGAANLPARMATAASTAYSRNVAALLQHLVRDGAVRIDPADEIQAGVVVTHRGTLVNPVVAADLAHDLSEV